MAKDIKYTILMNDSEYAVGVFDTEEEAKHALAYIMRINIATSSDETWANTSEGMSNNEIIATDFEMVNRIIQIKKPNWNSIDKVINILNKLTRTNK